MEKSSNKIKRVTVSDVAKKAGVSPSTVSRVISNNPRISDDTKKRVLKIMEELNFSPNAIARSLANNKTYVIGVVLPRRKSELFLNPFFPEALRGILKGANSSPYDILITSNSKDKDELSVIKSLVSQGKVDGIILLSSTECDPNIRYLKGIDFPFTVVGSDSGFNTNHVNNDNVLAAYELTCHLLKNGRKNIIFTAGGLEYSVTRERIEGFKKALKDYGIPYSNDLIYTGNFDEETGIRLAEELLNGGNIPSAIVATDDSIAFGIEKYLMEHGIKIPEDLIIGSFNNSILSRYSKCPITTIDINASKLGYEAFMQVIRAIDGLRGETKIIDHTLIIRESSQIK